MKTVLTLVFVGIVCLVRAQVYTVLKVSGHVESSPGGKVLQHGDKISGKDQIKFIGHDAYIVVTSARTGNKKISGVPDAAPREFVQLLTSFILPDKKSTASRSFGMDYVELLHASMNSDTLLVLGDGLIPVNTAQLPLKAPASIIAMYTSNKSKHRQVISTSAGFCLMSKCLFGDGVQDPLPKVAVYYFTDDKEDMPEHLLGAFVPMYVKEGELLKEINILTTFLSTEKKDADVFSEIREYLRNEYALVQEDNLKNWLRQNGVRFN